MIQSELPKWPLMFPVHPLEWLWFQTDDLELKEQRLKLANEVYSNVWIHLLSSEGTKNGHVTVCLLPLEDSVSGPLQKAHAYTDREQQNSLWKSSRPTALICYGSNVSVIKRNSNPCSPIIQSPLYKGVRGRKVILHHSTWGWRTLQPRMKES